MCLLLSSQVCHRCTRTKRCKTSHAQRLEACMRNRTLYKSRLNHLLCVPCQVRVSPELTVANDLFSLFTRGDILIQGSRAFCEFLFLLCPCVTSPPLYLIFSGICFSSLLFFQGETTHVFAKISINLISHNLTS